MYEKTPLLKHDAIEALKTFGGATKALQRFLADDEPFDEDERLLIRSWLFMAEGVAGELHQRFKMPRRTGEPGSICTDRWTGAV